MAVEGSQRVAALAQRGQVRLAVTRAVPEEVPVAFTYGRQTHAVMMASPCDLEDFAVGFSLTEEIAADAGAIGGIEVVRVAEGIELRIDLRAEAAERLAARRRRLAGPVGCGLCGIESLAEAVRAVRGVGGALVLSPAEIGEALAVLAPAQRLNAETHAVHAAGFWRPGAGLLALREDVGRHNALDKLIGALARARTGAADGAILLTSRVSVEMVQKAAIAGASVVVAVSAPTALAVRLADAAGMTLVAIARNDGFEIFTHPERIPAFPASRVSAAHVA